MHVSRCFSQLLVNHLTNCFSSNVLMGKLHGIFFWSGPAAFAVCRWSGPEPYWGQSPAATGPALEPAAGGAGAGQDLPRGTDKTCAHLQVTITDLFAV